MDPALYKAATQGDFQSIRDLIAKDSCLLNSLSPQRNTVLHIAARLGHREFAEDICRTSHKLLMSKNMEGDTPLHLATRAGHVSIVELLINYASLWPEDVEAEPGPLRMTNRQGNTPLHEAVKHGHSKIALKLLHADPGVGHVINQEKASPLHIAAREGLADVVREILQHPWVESAEEVERPPVGTGSPLHQAVLGGHLSIMKMLLDSRSDLVRVVDGLGNNALHYAAQKDSAKMVEILLENYPSLAYITNNDGKSPLHVAADYGSKHAIKEILQHCRDAAEQVVDSTGMNALHIAVMSGHLGSLKCLLKHIDLEEIINKPDSSGNTPLHLAAKHSRIQSSLQLLDDERVDPCIVNAWGRTARNEIEALDEVNTYQMYIWKKLKKHEDRRCKEDRLGTTGLSRTSFGRKRTAPDEHFKLSVETYTLVAALIATVTFAATFTMPGGFNQQNGSAILGKRAAFKVFVISNSLAMCCSLVVMFCFIWASKDPVQFKLRQLTWGHRLTVVACLAMIVTLMTAVYLVIAEECLWLAIVVILIGCSAPIMVCALLGYDILFIPM